jgi:hypothetical protein
MNERLMIYLTTSNVDMWLNNLKLDVRRLKLNDGNLELIY